MSRVTFIPHPNSQRSADGWPDKVQGDGFIDLRLVYEEGAGFAVYRDNFAEEYEFYGVSTAGQWTVEVRED